MERFTAHISHTEESIRRLSQVQYDIFGIGKKLRIFLTGLLLLGVSLFVELYQTASILLMLLGCWLLVSMNMPQRRQADKLIALIQGDYPSSAYSFSGEGLTVRSAGTETFTAYNRMVALAQDQSYFYIFISRMSAYMFPKDTLSPQDAQGFADFIARETGLSFVKPCSLLGISARELNRRMHNRRVLQQRRKSNP